MLLPKKLPCSFSMLSYILILFSRGCYLFPVRTLFIQHFPDRFGLHILFRHPHITCVDFRFISCLQYRSRRRDHRRITDSKRILHDQSGNLAIFQRVKSALFRRQIPSEESHLPARSLLCRLYPYLPPFLHFPFSLYSRNDSLSFLPARKLQAA